MRKLFRFTPMLITLVLLTYQLLVPIGHAFASTSMLPPSNLSVTKVTPDDIKLSWSTVTGATSYNVYEIKDGQILPLGNVTSTTYSLNNLSEGSYQFVVSTLTTEGESGPSAPVSVDISYPKMTAPANLTSTIKNGNDIVLSWDASQNVETYHVYQVSGNGEKELITAITGRTYTISNVPEGKYTYSVSAENSLYGESSLSTPLEVEVVHPTMTAPSNFTYTVANGNDVTLKWDSVAFAKEYNVYQVKNGERVLESTVTNTSLKLTNVASGEYKYEVRSTSDRFGESAEGSLVIVNVGSITMTAPENFTYRLQNINDIVLTWGTVPYADNYKIYQVIDGEKVLKSTVTNTSASFRNMAAGDYEYEVYSYSNRFGESQNGSKVSLSIESVTMTAPQDFTYTVQNGNDIVLSWENTSNAENYKIYQINDGEKVLKSTVTGTTARYNNLPEGNYNYEITSNSSRFGESQESNKLFIDLIHPTMEPPANIEKTIKSASSFTLSWDASSYATNYKVYQLVDGEKVLKSTVTGTSVTYTNLAPGEYTYVVTSNSTRFGESSKGNEINVTLSGLAMEAPTDLTHTISSGNDITLKWTSVPNTNTYTIYQIIDGERILQKTVTGTSVKFTNMPEGNYQYEVHSYSTLYGESDESAALKFSLVHPAMEAPVNVTYKVQNGNDVTLNWGAVDFATSYKVYEMIDQEKVLLKTVSSLSTVISNVSEGEHTYIVYSESSRFGESANGSEASLTMVYPIMEEPENLSSAVLNGNDIRLKWDASSYATGYAIYRMVDGQPVLERTVTGTTFTFTNMPEGDYTYEVRSVSSRFGESKEGSKTSITLVHPIMQAPGNLTQSIVNGNDVVLRWNASAYATGYKVYKVVDGKAILERTITGTSTTFTNMPEGDYAYIVHSYSNRFDESPKGSTIEFSLIWPTVQSPQVNGTVVNVNNIALAWPAVTWANEYRVYKISNDERELIYKGTARNFNVNNLTEDTHSFEVTAYSNRFGESKPSNRITQTIVYPIMEPPTASITLVNETSARINWNFITYANGYNIYEVIDGELVLIAEKVNNLMYTVMNLTYENHEYVVTSYSNSFGESAPSNIVLAKLIIDEEAPETTSDAPTDWVNQDQVITLSATDNETGVAKTYYSVDGNEFTEGTSFEVMGEGVHKVSFYSVDKAGNKEEAQTIEVKIDKTAPLTTSDAKDIWSKEDVTVNLTEEDKHSGVTKTYYSINGSEYIEGTSFVVETEGLNLVSYYSVDKAGNKEEPQTISVKIDKSAPVTTSDAPESWSTEDVTVNLEASDQVSGVTATFYSINGSDYEEGTSFTLTDEGIHEVSFFSIDNANNMEDVQTVEVKIDKTAPKVNMEVNEEYALNSTLSFLYTAEDTVSGIVDEKMIVTTPGETSGKEVQNGSSISLDKPGVYNITILATNAAGLTTEIYKQFVVYIPATIEVTPKVIKGNNGIFTVRVDVPEQFDPKDFELDKATINGVNALTSNKGYYNQAKLGQFKFERSDFIWDSSEETLVFRGYLHGYLVIGQTTVRVQK